MDYGAITLGGIVVIKMRTTHYWALIIDVRLALRAVTHQLSYML